MPLRPSAAALLLLAFALASLAAVLAGAAICAAAGVPAALIARNLIAWALGAALAGGLAFTARPAWLGPITLIAVVAMAATLAGAGQEGVHRWIELGPLRLNAALTVLPLAVVALAAPPPGPLMAVTEATRNAPLPRLRAHAAALPLLLLTVVQPDISQAAALGLAVAVLAIARPPSPAGRWAMLALAAAAVAGAALRPDPLEPVPEVEGVFALAFAQSPWTGAAAALALAAACLTPAGWALATRKASATPQATTPAFALSACLAATALAPVFGAFPTPLVGIGPSPILGAWLAVGLLAALAKSSPDPA